METNATELKGHEIIVDRFKTKEELMIERKERMREREQEARWRLRNQQREMFQQFHMTQRQEFIPMQMPYAMPMTSPLMGSSSMCVMGPQSFKDRLKQELLDRCITGAELKKKLSSISEEQAKILCKNQEKLNEWLQCW